MADIPVVYSVPLLSVKAVTYSLVDALFAVDAGTGEVSLVGSLDMESATSHSLTVTATDGSRSHTTLVQVWYIRLELPST